MPLRIMTVYGTRPEAIKVAPVLRALDEADGIESIPVVTGQHREMLDQVNDLFGIRPVRDLDIMTRGQSLNGIASHVIGGIDDVLEELEPDAVLVQGDTSTVMGAALAAFHRRVPVIHLEAGLRSQDVSSPFPEEANRCLTTIVTDLHLAPTARARENLLREGVDGDDVVVTGNTVIDALLRVSEETDVPLSDARLAEVARRRAADPDHRVVLVTAHRRETHGAAMRSIGEAVADLVRRGDVSVVLPLHRNPRVREAILPAVDRLEDVVVVEPLEYAQFVKVLMMSDVILTDSGGIQEEAPSLGKPVLVMRENTERPDAIDAGTVRLVGTDGDRIVAETSRLLDSSDAYAEMSRAVSPYGDGRAARRVVEAIAWRHLGGPRPADFVP